MKFRVAFVVAPLVGFALALTGCTSAGPEPTSSPTADGDGTVAQWASIVAEQKASVEEWKADWDADTCSVGTDFRCNVKTTTGTFVAKTAAISLASPETATAKNYIGVPPSEIRGLYSDTRNAAEAFEEAGDAWSASCSAGKPTNDECDALLFKFGNAADSLLGKFAAWSPYL